MPNLKISQLEKITNMKEDSFVLAVQNGKNYKMSVKEAMNSYIDLSNYYTKEETVDKINDCIAATATAQSTADTALANAATAQSAADAAQDTANSAVTSINTINNTTIPGLQTSITFNTNLINRPSRIFYRKNYDGLTPEEIKEIAEDLLFDKSLEEDLISTASRMFQISFDTLISIIEEVNRYGEPASQCVLNMNLTPMKILFDAWQLVKDEKKGVIKLRAGDGVQIQYDETNGKTYFELRYNFDSKIKTKNGTVKTEADYTWINVDFNNFKKTSIDTYEMCNGEFMFILKERSFCDYGYGYSNKGILKPNGEVPNKLIQFKNEDGTYTYSENYPITIKILEQSRYISNGELEAF